MHMPVMDGLAFLRQLSAEAKMAVPTIVVTCSTHDPWRSRRWWPEPAKS